jgi:hypothetical protein
MRKLHRLYSWQLCDLKRDREFAIACLVSEPSDDSGTVFEIVSIVVGARFPEGLASLREAADWCDGMRMNPYRLTAAYGTALSSLGFEEDLEVGVDRRFSSAVIIRRRSACP